MKYNPPFGTTDPDAIYVNGDPSTGIKGSIPPAASIEYPQREIVNTIDSNKFAPTNSDLYQLLRATRSQRSNYCVDTGSVNTLSVALDPPLAAYTVGLPLHVRIYATNTGGSSLDAGCGRSPIRRPDGSNTQPGDLPAGGIAGVVWDGAVWQMMNYLGGAAAGDVINNFQNVPYTVDVSTTPNIITANFSPAITTLSAGTLFLVKIANTCTADTIINVNAILNKPVRTNGADKLLPGDIQVGDIKLFSYDGTSFHIEADVDVPNAVTINVPTTQFPNVASALGQLDRKSFAATVTIKLATGIYPAISVNHKDASKLVIKGTMLTSAPTPANFSQTGNSAAARLTDNTNNIAMLRARYGSEIRVTGATQAFTNIGPGEPLLIDMLVTGDGSVNSIGIATSVSYPLSCTSRSQNVAIWCFYFGYYGGGSQRIIGGSVSNCSYGVFSQTGAAYHIDNSGGIGFIACGNAFAGLIVVNGSLMILNGEVQSNCNASYGLYCAYGSTIAQNGQTSAGVFQANGVFDGYCSDTSEIVLHTAYIYTYSPPLNYIGNFNAIIHGI